ncbi:MAG: DUF1552 domain-containing protein, partial [Deltaproteobacteria bacterium]
MMAGFTNSSNRSSTVYPVSIDYWLGKKMGSTTKLANLALGWQSQNASFLYDLSGVQRPPIDDPTNAYQTMFGSVSSTASSAGAPASSYPRTSILDLVRSQLKGLQGSLGSEAKARLGYHLDSISQLENSLSAPVTVGGAGCSPSAPNLGGALPGSDTSAAAVMNAQAKLIVTAFGCDVTRVASLQLGTNQALHVPNPAGGVFDAHGQGAHGQTSDAIAIESYLASWFAGFVTSLKNAPDSANGGSGSLLDNTMVIWLRDMGDGSSHSTYSTPIVLAGATDYLKSSPNGVYVNMGGMNTAVGTQRQGPSHMKVLLNAAEYLGVSSYSGFGDFTKDPSQAVPL